MAEGCFRVRGGLDRFRLECLRLCIGGLGSVEIGCRLLLREQGRMNLTSLGDGLRLGLSLLDIA